MMLTKALIRSFKYSRRNIPTVCYTLLHITEIDIDSIKPFYACLLDRNCKQRIRYAVMSNGSMDVDGIASYEMTWREKGAMITHRSLIEPYKAKHV
jgi:hypothetical protein